MKTLILAGGLGSRLAEETVRIPKPMVEVGGRPIIVRVMDIYSHFGHRDFVVAAGYKAVLLKQFFASYHLESNNVTVALRTGKLQLSPVHPQDWNVSIVDTGEDTMTGGRISRARDWVGGETFMATYSDGVGNIDINALLRFHRSHGKLATVTAVQPPARFGSLELDGNRVTEFSEKVLKHVTWINGGFFVFEPGIMDYLSDDAGPLELAPLSQIARDGQLMAFKHYGFWHPMDTIRDRDHLSGLCREATPPWLDFSGIEDEADPQMRRA
jgi:glucose-1-phosphate cytidylyltransferase